MIVRQQLLFQPIGASVSMAQQAGIGALFGPEPQGHCGVRDIIYLMGSGLKQKAVHDGRHVAGDTAATFRLNRMTRVPFSALGELRMTLQAHPVGLVEKLKRFWVRRSVLAVGIVAVAATHLAFLEASRSI